VSCCAVWRSSPAGLPERRRPGVAGAEITGPEVVEGVADLVAKSLVTADVGGVMVRYRLPETVRSYALQKLAESGEREVIARRHAEYHRDLLERAAAEAATQPAACWLAACRPHLDNLRTALDSAFSPDGDAAMAVRLTLAAIPLWFGLSLFPECRRYVERAIAFDAPGASDPRAMQLCYALAASLFHTAGPVLETCDAWTKVLQIARSLGETEYQLRALWGLWSYRLNSGEYERALTLAEDFRRLAATQSDPTDLAMADRMIGSTTHYLGDQANARRHLERARDRYVEPAQGSNIARFQLHPRIATLSVLGRVLWLQGFADQALRTAAQTVAEAETLGHTVTMFNALLAAGQVALLAGDLPAAARYAAMLMDLSAGQAMAIWTAWAQGLNAMLLIKRGESARGVDILRATLGELRAVGSTPRYAVFFAPFATGLAQLGEIAEGLAVIEEATEQCQRYCETWIMAELLRVKGELLLQSGRQAAGAAEDSFRRSLDLAHRQGALAWELRAATSLARLRRELDQIAEARDLLASVHDRFIEGFETADLRTAKHELTDGPGAARSGQC
jgi:predicted ATPase